jgi:hypothetical protein
MRYIYIIRVPLAASNIVIWARRTRRTHRHMRARFHARTHARTHARVCIEHVGEGCERLRAYDRARARAAPTHPHTLPAGRLLLLLNNLLPTSARLTSQPNSPQPTKFHRRSSASAAAPSRTRGRAPSPEPSSSSLTAPTAYNLDTYVCACVYMYDTSA